MNSSLWFLPNTFSGELLESVLAVTKLESCRMVDIALAKEDYRAVLCLLVAYNDWLEDWSLGLEGEEFMHGLDSDATNLIKKLIASVFDVAHVYTKLEQKCHSEITESAKWAISECISEIRESYPLLKEWLGDCENKQILEAFEEQVYTPLDSAIKEKVFDSICSRMRRNRFSILNKTNK